MKTPSADYLDKVINLVERKNKKSEAFPGSCSKGNSMRLVAMQ